MTANAGGSYTYTAAITCCICVNIEDDLNFAVLPNCSHVYHTACIGNWIDSCRNGLKTRTPECPSCRVRICSKTSKRPLKKLVVTIGNSESLCKFTLDEADEEEASQILDAAQLVALRGKPKEDVIDVDSEEEEEVDAEADSRRVIRDLRNTLFDVRQERDAAIKERDKVMEDAKEMEKRALAMVETAKDQADASAAVRTEAELLASQADQKVQRAERRREEAFKVRDEEKRKRHEAEAAHRGLQDRLETIKQHMQQELADERAAHAEREAALQDQLQREVMDAAAIDADREELKGTLARTKDRLNAAAALLNEYRAQAKHPAPPQATRQYPTPTSPQGDLTSSPPPRASTSQPDFDIIDPGSSRRAFPSRAPALAETRKRPLARSKSSQSAFAFIEDEDVRHLAHGPKVKKRR